MWAAAFIGVMVWMFVSAFAAGTIGALLLALATSIGGAVVGMALKWNEQNMWLALMAAPALLLMVLLSSAILDRLARVRESAHRFGSRFGPEKR